MDPSAIGYDRVCTCLLLGKLSVDVRIRDTQG